MFLHRPRPPSVDINLARTFLEIASSRSFVQAAERLHVTQTAVSARVKTLEALLGRQLFWRNKAGASLTHVSSRRSTSTSQVCSSRRSSRTLTTPRVRRRRGFRCSTSAPGVASLRCSSRLQG